MSGKYVYRASRAVNFTEHVSMTQAMTGAGFLLVFSGTLPKRINFLLSRSVFNGNLALIGFSLRLQDHLVADYIHGPSCSYPNSCRRRSKTCDFFSTWSNDGQVSGSRSRIDSRSCSPFPKTGRTQRHQKRNAPSRILRKAERNKATLATACRTPRKTITTLVGLISPF